MTDQEVNKTMMMLYGEIGELKLENDKLKEILKKILDLTGESLGTNYYNFKLVKDIKEVLKTNSSESTANEE